MHVRENATEAGEEDEDNYDDFGGDTDGAFFNVFRENSNNEEENCGNHHDVRGGEARFAGAVRAGVPDEEFVENDVSDSHEGERQRYPEELLVNLLDRFTLNPLVEAEAS